jgi:hypothetical protein
MFCRCHLCWLLINQIYIDPEFTLTALRWFEILPQQIRDKVWAYLATRFNVQKPVVRTIIKLDKKVTQHGKVRRSQGGDVMIGHHLAKKSKDSWDASFVQVEPCLPSVFAISDHSPQEKNTCL